MAKGPLPLVIGITGHRDLRPEDIPGLEKRVDSVFAQFEERYPETPLVLLSPLAEGADRLVARVALKRGARLVCPLPMLRAEYIIDFVTEESQAEFETLLSQAERIIELPFLPGNNASNVCDVECRAEQYAFVGAYVVRHSQILIALWNGVQTRNGGGTAEIVGFQREGIPERFRNQLMQNDPFLDSLLDTPETGPTYHIVTPRSGHPEIEGKPLELIQYFPGDAPEDIEDAEVPESQATFERIYANINAFNQNALLVESDPRLKALCQRNLGYLLPEPVRSDLSPGLQALCYQYAVTDTVAQHFQRGTFQVLKVLSGIILVAGITFELSAKLAPDNAVFALFFPVLVGVAWLGWFSTVSRGQWQDRYQDYRALAEGLRVEIFWRLAGISTSVADNYLRKQRGELDWIRIAIHNLSESAGMEEVSEGELGERLDLVREHWVRNQGEYFERAMHRDERELERFEFLVQVLIVTSPIIALLTALAELVPSPAQDWMHHHPLGHKMLIIAVFVLAAVAGVFHTYIDKRALAEHTKQYERMRTLFLLAEQRLKRRLEEGRFADAHKLLLELGKESLAENGDWIMTHRERPVDVPHAG